MDLQLIRMKWKKQDEIMNCYHYAMLTEYCMRFDEETILLSNYQDYDLDYRAKLL